MIAEDFYSILRDAAKYYPVGNRWNTIQAFRVLEHEAAMDIINENMGAGPCDIDTPYFYSTPWEQAGRDMNNITGAFPLLTVFQQSANIGKFFGGVGDFQPVLGITVWDKVEQDKGGKCDNGYNRSISQVWRDTFEMLLTVLDYVKGVKYSVIDGDKTGWYNEAFLQQLQERGVISKYSATKPLAARLLQGNENMQTFQELINSHQIAGTSVKITMDGNLCSRPSYDFESQNLSLLNINKSCC